MERAAVGPKLRAIMVANGLTQREVLDRLEADGADRPSQASLSMWLSGDRYPSPPMLARLLEAVDASPRDCLDILGDHFGAPLLHIVGLGPDAD